MGIDVLNPPTTPANLKARADQLAFQLNLRANAFRRKKYLVPFGMDFRCVKSSSLSLTLRVFADFKKQRFSSTI